MRAGGAIWAGQARRGGLRRFAVAITVLNILGHVWFGFEQAWVVPFVAVAAAYFTEWLLEFVESRTERRSPRYVGPLGARIDFFLSAHITGLACGMLLYAGDRLWPVVFAAVTAIASKSLLRVRLGAGTRHFLNPSNFGITATLLLFPWVGIAPPYQFTEQLGPVGDWVLPAIIIVSGSFLNARFTGRLPLIAAWLGGFVLQAAVRTAMEGMPFLPHLLTALAPMTGLAFVLYTFYMVTDPATTPEEPRAQLTFGAAVAGIYGVLLALHVVFGLFFALAIVSAARGAFLSAAARVPARAVAPAREAVAVAVPQAGVKS